MSVAVDHHSELMNKTFGRLTVINVFRAQKYITCTCDCSCGQRVDVLKQSLIKGATVSCGCYGLERTRMFGVNKPRKDIKSDGESSFNYMWHTYKRNAKKRNYVFELKKEDFRVLVKGNCNYCGIEPRQKYKYFKRSTHHGAFICNGVDRVDNSLGYTLENSVSCCSICNRAKLDLSENEFREWLGRLNANYKK